MSWADGMVGACPAFDNYDDALKYSDNNPSIIHEAEEVLK
jgi:hypothetical protein